MKFTTTMLVLACLSFLAGGVIAADPCNGLQNLEQENHLRFAAPTVVDINEANGNLLVRGPLPLIIRDNAGTCLKQNDWKFAYDNLNAMLKSQAGYHPGYMTEDAKIAKLSAQLQNFDIKDYQLIDISLLNNADPTERLFFNTETRAYGSSDSTCNHPLRVATINGQGGSLVHSMMTQCNPTDIDCLHNQVFLDGTTFPGNFCSLRNLTTQINTLMKETDPSNKKRLIYYHDALGINRASAVTMTYLMRRDLNMSIVDIQDYAQNLGDLEPDTSRVPAGGWVMAAPFTAIATTYCTEAEYPWNSPRCSYNEPQRVSLPGSDTHSHLPGQDTAPQVTPAPTAVPTPIQTIVPAQTPVPSVRYNPASSGDRI
jgi:hypothetical protein